MLKKLFLALFLVAVVVPVVAFAQVTLNLSYPNFGPFNPATNQSLGAIIGYVYYLIVGIAGLAAFVMLIWGGVQWLVSGAIPSQASEARDKVRNAIIGLLLVLASFLIAQAINPALTIINVDFLSLGDRSDLGRWLFGGASGSADYRCGPFLSGSFGVGGDMRYACEGNPPETPKPESCVSVTRLNDTGDLVIGGCGGSVCKDAGGELAEFNGNDNWYCCNVTIAGRSCEAGPPSNREVVEFPVTPVRTPLMQSIMRTRFGVYGCDDDGCVKAWRWFFSDTPNVCGSDVADSSPENEDICSGGIGGGTQIGSLWIHGPFVAVLYEHAGYSGERICFDARDQALYPSPPGLLINRLDDYDGWGNQTNSLRILQEGDPEIETICSVGGSPAFQVTL